MLLDLLCLLCLERSLVILWEFGLPFGGEIADESTVQVTSSFRYVLFFFLSNLVVGSLVATSL